MIRRPPRSTRTDTLFPYTTLFRSALQSKLGAAHVDFRLGLDVFTDDALQDVHTIVLSPGLSPLQEPIKSFLALAAARQIQVVGEIELFARALADMRSEEHTSELQSLMRISYAVFCLKKKNKYIKYPRTQI